MSAETHSIFFGQADTGFRRPNVSGVAAAGHIRGGNRTHQGTRRRHRFAFAEIAVEVEFHCRRIFTAKAQKQGPPRITRISRMESKLAV
jgi:hypothetical protein